MQEQKNYMEKYAWKAIVKDGMLEEYKRRHDNIWQELKDVLEKAGIVFVVTEDPVF